MEEANLRAYRDQTVAELHDAANEERTRLMGALRDANETIRRTSAEIKRREREARRRDGRLDWRPPQFQAVSFTKVLNGTPYAYLAIYVGSAWFITQDGARCPRPRMPHADFIRFVGKDRVINVLTSSHVIKSDYDGGNLPF